MVTAPQTPTDMSTVPFAWHPDSRIDTRVQGSGGIRFGQQRRTSRRIPVLVHVVVDEDVGTGDLARRRGTLLCGADYGAGLRGETDPRPVTCPQCLSAARRLTAAAKVNASALKAAPKPSAPSSKFDEFKALCFRPLRGLAISQDEMVTGKQAHPECYGCGGGIELGERHRVLRGRYRNAQRTFRWCNACCREMAAGTFKATANQEIAS